MKEETPHRIHLANLHRNSVTSGDWLDNNPKINRGQCFSICPGGGTLLDVSAGLADHVLDSNSKIN